MADVIGPYEPPRVLSLSVASPAVGANCEPGSNASTDCNTGTSAAAGCGSDGNSAVGCFNGYSAGPGSCSPNGSGVTT